MDDLIKQVANDFASCEDCRIYEKLLSKLKQLWTKHQFRYGTYTDFKETVSRAYAGHIMDKHLPTEEKIRQIGDK